MLPLGKAEGFSFLLTGFRMDESVWFYHGFLVGSNHGTLMSIQKAFKIDQAVGWQ